MKRIRSHVLREPELSSLGGKTRCIFLALIALVVALPCRSACGRSDTPNPEPSVREWFRSLRQPGNGLSCCDIADCRYVEHRYVQDHYEVQIEHNWLPVPG